MSISKIVNRTERLFCFPPITVWPKEARSVRAPGDSVSQMQMPGGSLAEPAAVYPAVSAWPALITTHNKDGRPCLPEAEGAVAISESNPQEYWDIVIPKCQALIAQGMVEFLRDDQAADGEKAMRALEDKIRGGVDLKGKPDNIAIQFVDLENDKDMLKKWLANESRPKVKKAIQNRLANV